jgi:hypothetical protein
VGAVQLVQTVPARQLQIPVSGHRHMPCDMAMPAASPKQGTCLQVISEIAANSSGAPSHLQWPQFQCCAGKRSNPPVELPDDGYIHKYEN